MLTPYFQLDGPSLTRLEAENARIELRIKALGGTIPENFRRPEFLIGDSVALESMRRIRLLEELSRLLSKQP